MRACVALVHAVAELSSLSETITISLGFACETCGENVSMLLNRADEALYSAKLSGKNCVKAHRHQA